MEYRLMLCFDYRHEDADVLMSLQAAAYSAFRPTYPADLYEHIYKFADLQRFDLAVDIATGSGQAASVLAKRFKKVSP